MAVTRRREEILWTANGDLGAIANNTSQYLIKSTGKFAQESGGLVPVGAWQHLDTDGFDRLILQWGFKVTAINAGTAGTFTNCLLIPHLRGMFELDPAFDAFGELAETRADALRAETVLKSRHTLAFITPGIDNVKYFRGNGATSITGFMLRSDAVPVVNDIVQGWTEVCYPRFIKDVPASADVILPDPRITGLTRISVALTMFPSWGAGTLTSLTLEGAVKAILLRIGED